MPQSRNKEKALFTSKRHKTKNFVMPTNPHGKDPIASPQTNARNLLRNALLERVKPPNLFCNRYGGIVARGRGLHHANMSARWWWRSTSACSVTLNIPCSVINANTQKTLLRTMRTYRQYRSTNFASELVGAIKVHCFMTSVTGVLNECFGPVLASNETSKLFPF